MGTFFIRRPIVAMVLSIVMVLAGAVALRGLPIAQYPDITPPLIQVTASYYGASAVDVEQAVSTPLEQQINGVDRMIYMKSTNANDGTAKVEVSFEVGADLDMSNVLVQNRVSQATAALPASVKASGVTVKKSLSFPLLVVSLSSPSGQYDNAFLSNYAAININDAMARIPGVGGVTLFGGSDYAMRVWVRPDLLKRYGLTVGDLSSALQQQNTLTPAGQLGGAPAPPGTAFTYTVRTQGRLLTAEEFGDVLVKATADGAVVRLKDVARIELGSLLYNAAGRLDGKSAATLAIYQAPGSNALDVAHKVEATLRDLSGRFPGDLRYEVTLDTTRPISEGINEIVHTLFEAVLLVILVVFVFLQNWRATLIPLLTVPVSLLGTFIVFPLLGFSVNVLSLLGLVLAIGIVVDDAIVVVEAVMHHIEHGLSPKEATAQAMKEVSGPVVAIALVLTAVFVPVAFMPGLTGSLYQQFALTIAISVLFSALNALTLSPALAGLLLKPAGGKRSPLQPFYDAFNRVFGRFTAGYVGLTGLLVRKAVRSLVLVAAVTAGAVLLAGRVPGGFLPDEDNGYLLVNVMLPDAASLQRTTEVAKKAEAIVLAQPGVAHVTAVDGFSLISGSFASNNAFFFVSLKEWAERGHGESAQEIIKALNGKLAFGVPEAIAFAFGPPPIPGLGTGSGFSMMIQDRAGGTPQALQAEAERFIAAARKRPEIGSINTFFRATVPQVQATVDREKALKLGVPLAEVNGTLGALLGSSYVNDFNRFGRVYKVFLQAEPEFRADAGALGQFFARGSGGQMVPLDTLVRTSPASGPESTNRFNLFRAAELSGVPAPGYSSGQALEALEAVAKETLGAGYGYDWSNVSFQEKRASGSSTTVFALAMLLVFLILAAQYESWALPFSVVLGTPFAAFGAFLGLWLGRLSAERYVNNVFAQIGLVMLVGLAAKNAILIVEFAKEEMEKKGASPVDAAMTAARLRFRPILMTAFAFILGVVPLMTASGAGAEARVVMGVTVFSGMLVATILGVLLVPVLFVVVEGLKARFSGGGHAAPPAPAAAPQASHPGAHP